MVTLSSLNRHAVATLADVGVPKVTACKRFFERVAPWVEIDARIELWKLGAGGEDLLQWGDSHVDWVVGQSMIN
jgi:tRNA A37 threonylcarbamoyladenosine dehydratase